jgi:hypothetical protein
VKRDDTPPTTAPHNRTCKEIVPLLLLAWPYFLVKGIRMERARTRAGGSR